MARCANPEEIEASWTGCIPRGSDPNSGKWLPGRTWMRGGLPEEGLRQFVDQISNDFQN